MDGSQRRPDAQLNVLGEPLTSCSHDPLRTLLGAPTSIALDKVAILGFGE